jgi:hypothetical protein
MKKFFTFIGLFSFILIIGITVIGCGGGSPSSVVKKLHTAVEKGDANEINKLMEPQAAGLTIKMLSEIQTMSADSGGIAKTEESITGDKAKVKVTYKNGDTDDFDLVKIDGKWLVTIDFSK